MITRLRGQVLENHGTSVVVDCCGVGYEVQVPTTTAFQLPLNADADLYVRQVFREDDVALYGFVDADERRVFDLLRDVKGCGPKTSLAVISDLGAHGTLQAVLAQDGKALTRVSGVGPRLAERMIVELKDKVPQVELDRKLAAVNMPTGPPRPTDELVDALMALGYRRTEAETAAATVRDESDSVAEQLRLALRSLTR